MASDSRLAQLAPGLLVAIIMITSSPLAAESEAPAGQMCPNGAFVIGFDSEMNIICSELNNTGVFS